MLFCYWIKILEYLCKNIFDGVKKNEFIGKYIINGQYCLFLVIQVDECMRL